MTGLKDEDIIDPDEARALILNPVKPATERIRALAFLGINDAKTKEAIFQLVAEPPKPGPWHDQLLCLAGAVGWGDESRKAAIAAALFRGADAILSDLRSDDPKRSYTLRAILHRAVALLPQPLTGATINPLLPMLQSKHEDAPMGILSGLTHASILVPAETSAIDPAFHAELARVANGLLEDSLPPEAFVFSLSAFLAAALLDAPTIGHLTPERIGNARELWLEQCSAGLNSILRHWIQSEVPESRRAKIAALAAAFEAARPAFGIKPLRESQSYFFGKLA